MQRAWKNLRADIGAGLLLLIPLGLALFIFGKLWNAVHVPVRALAARWDLEGRLTVNVLLLITLIVLVLIVLLVGKLVRSRGEGGLRAWLEKVILNHVPGYTYSRIILEARLGITNPPTVRPALLRTGDGWQPVYQVEAIGADHCVVFLPDAPLGGSGSVLLVETAKVRVLEGSILPMDHALRLYGKGLGALVGQLPKAGN